VPYVPTPDEAVFAMLRLAAVTNRDVVYDLGSGDGRIVIAAARDFGARGVGLEIDRVLVEKSRKNASAAGVDHRVEFVHADLFRTDISRATVVTFYLLPSVAEALRPKLLRELAPGTRIVSHNYGMGDWQPRQTVRVDDRHVVHLWIVPQKSRT
jgi:ribosomal protein L11 methylase PrmA